MFFKNIDVVRNNERLGAILDKRRPKRHGITKYLTLGWILHQVKTKQNQKSNEEHYWSN